MRWNWQKLEFHSWHDTTLKKSGSSIIQPSCRIHPRWSLDDLWMIVDDPGWLPVWILGWFWKMSWMILEWWLDDICIIVRWCFSNECQGISVDFGLLMMKQTTELWFRNSFHQVFQTLFILYQICWQWWIACSDNI